MAIGTLTVGVAANAAKGIASLKGFRKEVKGVKADCSIASTSLQGMTSALTRVAGPLAAAGAAYVSTRHFLTVAQDLDLVAKTSAKLDVAPVKLMGLRHAAEQTGVATQTLDNALSKMTIRASEAAKGGGDAANVLKELGIDAKAFTALSADQQFVKIAGAMAGQTSQADKLRIATKLFEEEGAALVNTLALGEQGLAKMTAESAKLSGSFSAAELAKVEAMNDELDKLSKVLGGISSEIVIDIAPAASEAVGALREAMEYWRQWRGQGKETKPETAGEKRNKALTLGLFTDEEVKNDWMTQQWRKVFSFDYAGGLTGAEKATQLAREAKANAAAKAFEGMGLSDDELNNRVVGSMQLDKMVQDSWKGASGAVSGVAGKLFDGLSNSLNTVGSTINSTVAATNAAKRQGLINAAQGLNPLTGLAPLGMSDARKNLRRGPDDFKLGPVSDRINSLIDAGGSEGYQALRANQRQARLNPADKAAPKIEKSTQKAADGIQTLIDLWKKIPAPRSA